MILRVFLTLMLVLPVPQTTQAAVEVGGGSCFQVVSMIQRNWLELRRHLVPVSEKLDRTTDDHFVCVSPQMTRMGVPARVGVSSNVKCFRNPATQGLGYCCDSQLTSCAQLNPGLFPDYFERLRAKEKPYEAPASDWVTPPSEGDQWKSN